jgi:hypothetical protein
MGASGAASNGGVKSRSTTPGNEAAHACRRPHRSLPIGSSARNGGLIAKSAPPDFDNCSNFLLQFFLAARSILKARKVFELFAL